MKKRILSPLLTAALFLAMTCGGQIKYQKGYFVDNSGNRTECLIRDVDWAFNPTYFDYKVDATAEKQRKEVHEVKEFAIENSTRYVSTTVQMDMSTDDLEDMSISRSYQPEWKETRLFLKVLVEGDATLYSFQRQGFLRLFYRMNDGEIDQLVYKRYKTKDRESSFTYNRSYLNQLFANVNCHHLPLNRFEDITYSKHSIARLFEDYNRCVHPDQVTAKPANKRKWLTISALAGLSFSSYKSTNDFDATQNVKLPSKSGFTGGAELGFILPFNNNKWSAVLGGFANSYKAAGLNDGGQPVAIKYNTLILYFAIRFSFFIDDNWKINLNAGVGRDIKQEKIIPHAGVGFSYSRFGIQLDHYLAGGITEYVGSPADRQHFGVTALTVRCQLL